MIGRIKDINIFRVLINTVKGFSEHKITKLAASLAYYTLFSIGPLIVLITTLAAFFFEKTKVEDQLFRILKDFVGADTAAQLEQIVKYADFDGKSGWAAIIGICTLLLGATSVFGEIQDSINYIWGLKAKPKRGLIKLILTRLLSFSVIATFGFLLLVSLILTSAIEAFTNYFHGQNPEIAVALVWGINFAITALTTLFIFAIIFKLLPDAKIKWNDVIAGSILTTILFLFGKFAISYYISTSNVGTTFGPAGAVIVLLVWVYYSSIILYIGALFTKQYTIQYGDQIHPNDYAVTTKEIIVETGKLTVQEKEQLVGDFNEKSQDEQTAILKEVAKNPKTDL